MPRIGERVHGIPVTGTKKKQRSVSLALRLRNAFVRNPEKALLTAAKHADNSRFVGRLKPTQVKKTKS
jgi:hypothetical protein